MPILYRSSLLLLASGLALLPQWAACLPGSVPMEALLTSRSDIYGECGSRYGGCLNGMCCSGGGYCGSNSSYCGSGCQSNYGSCQVVSPPSCSTSSGSANQRTVGYYRASNTDASCGGVSVSQLNTNGYTHLIYSFVEFDPNTFAIKEADPTGYTQFTNLATSSMVTWVSVGGGGDPSIAAAFSKMASSSANRQKFISSLKAFMAKYQFYGVDIDWEFVTTSSDTANFNALMSDINTAIGSNRGISLTLPADSGSLGLYDLRTLQNYVSFFNIMTYDMNHGKTTVHGATDLGDIKNDASQLYQSQVPMSKFNLGLAYYGTGFTLQSGSCNSEGCATTAMAVPPSSCGGFGGDGVWRLSDIQSFISSTGITPGTYHLQSGAYKTLTWNANGKSYWMGYDDADTFKLKRDWASSRCFGGSFVWEIDYYNHGRQ